MEIHIPVKQPQQPEQVLPLEPFQLWDEALNWKV